MKKLLRILGIIFVLIIIVLIGLFFYARSYLTSERLKSLIIPRIESATGMTARMEEINLSLLKGIVVKGFTLSEKETGGPFVNAPEFVLNYEFWPLLKRHLIIDSIELNDPSIFIVRKIDGTYNFSSVLKKKAEAPERKEPSRALPFDIAANKVDINNARLDFKDMQKSLPDLTAAFDAAFKLAYREQLTYSGKIDLKSLRTAVKGLQTETSGKIEVDDVISLKLNSSLGQDNIAIAGVVKNYRAAPDINLNISAQELHLEKLAEAAGKPSAPAKKKPPKAPSPGVEKLTASGKVSVKNALYKEYRITNFNLPYRLAKGVLSISPAGNISGGAKAYVEGALRAAFNMNIGGSDIAGTLAGKGTLDLARIQMRPSRLTEQVAAISGISTLRSPSFEKSRFNFDVKNKKADVVGSLLSPDIKVDPISGTVGFNKTLAMAFDVQLSPAISARIPAGQVGRFLKSETGWTVLPFIAGGTVSDPAVSLNKAALGKGVQRELQKEIQKRLFGPRKEGQPSQQPEDIFKKLFK
jgi:hypothetical protein